MHKEMPAESFVITIVLFPRPYPRFHATSYSGGAWRGSPHGSGMGTKLVHLAPPSDCGSIYDVSAQPRCVFTLKSSRWIHIYVLPALLYAEITLWCAGKEVTWRNRTEGRKQSCLTMLTATCIGMSLSDKQVNLICGSKCGDIATIYICYLFV